MKNLIFYSFLILLFSCENDKKKNAEDKENFPKIFIEEAESFEETLPFDTIYTSTDAELKKINSITIKRQSLIDKRDDKSKLEKFLTQKIFNRNADQYVIDFKYPYLNESSKPSYRNFNQYIEETYLNVASAEANILENKEKLLDTLRINRYKEKRFVNYKIYSLNKSHISVLFYKENYYSRTLRPTYSFDCLNYDLERSVFMNYEDFFNTGTETEMAEILNRVLSEKINSGEIYYDCWEINSEDFIANKNNFLINDNNIEYYFDDYVICPSYTGTYSVEIPLERLLPILKKYKSNPLI